MWCRQGGLAARPYNAADAVLFLKGERDRPKPAPRPNSAGQLAKSCDGMIRLRGSEMKAFVAALVAVGIQYAVDREYNDGRYSSVVQQAIAAMVPR